MDKEILVEYCEMKEEIKDIRRRIQELEKFLDKPPIVADAVKGSRADLIIGLIKVTGIPDPMYQRKKRALVRYKKILELKEAELLELMTQAEEYIDNIPKTEMQMIMRFYCIDGMTYVEVAREMNKAFPKRKIKYTDENIKKRVQRFFEKV